MASYGRGRGTQFKPGRSGKSGQNGDTVFGQGLARAEGGGRDSTPRGQDDRRRKQRADSLAERRRVKARQQLGDKARREVWSQIPGVLNSRLSSPNLS